MKSLNHNVLKLKPYIWNYQIQIYKMSRPYYIHQTLVSHRYALYKYGQKNSNNLMFVYYKMAFYTM